MSAEMNRRIRPAAGRPSPQEVAAAAIAAATKAGDAEAMRKRIASDAGLPTALASRLRGEDAIALAADAKVLAATLAELVP